MGDENETLEAASDEIRLAWHKADKVLVQGNKIDMVPFTSLH